jgi:MFS family permease
LTTQHVGGDHTVDPAGGPARGGRAGSSGGIFNRQLAHYPDNGPRTMYLAITVLATVVLYYELYIQGAVATSVIRDFHMTFTFFVMVNVVGNAVGAFASLLAGLADRWGRANLVVGGLLITGVLILVGLPNAGSKGIYLFLFAIVSFVEGVVLVATPALIRDFSPQVGRGAAMGFWTLGPVLGSLVVTVVSSHTLNSHSDWRFQFHVCGIAGLVVFVIAFVGLRELSPGLRDQLMVSLRDRALIEARAAGLDPEEALRGHWRQMLRPDIIGSAFAISIFLLFYYIAVGFFVVYFQTVFPHDYTQQRANALGNWYWATNAIALVVAGVLSDKVRVRKPFMIVGALIGAVGTALFALAATKPDTSYYTFAFYIILISAGGGIAYCNWMAAFTETVEKHNPAATATGLAIWGWIIRAVITVALAVFTFAVPATSTLVDQGPRAQEIATRYPDQVATLGAIDKATLGTLTSNPTSPDPVALDKAESEIVAAGLAPDKAGALSRLAKLTTSPVPPDDLNFLAANGEKVQKAQKDNPKQWQNWWWVTFAGQILFIPFVFLLTGRWSPKRAKQDELEHEQLVQAELARLSGQPGPDGGQALSGAGQA